MVADEPCQGCLACLTAARKNHALGRHVLIHREQFPNRISITTAVCIGLSVLLILVGPIFLHAQDHPTADDLFDHGMQSYSAGNYLEAQSTFRRLDPLQLNRKQRLLMYETIQNIDRQLKGISNPATAMKEAARAHRSGNLSQATKLYQSVIKHPGATKKQKKKAEVELAQIKRRRNAQLTRARESVDKAEADIRDGRYESAERRLRAVKESGLDLGWFENERINRQLTIIAEQRKSQRAAQKPSGPPTQAPTTKPTQAKAQPKPPSNDPASLEKTKRQNAEQEIAQREQAELQKRLAQQQQQLAQREQQLAEQEKAQRHLLQNLEAQRLKEQQELAQREQTQLQKRLAQQQQQLAQREQQLAEQEKAQRELLQRLEAERQRELQDQEKLAQQEQADFQKRLEQQRQQIAQREQQLAEKEKDQRELRQRLEAKRQQEQREQELAQRRETEERQRARELAQRREAKERQRDTELAQRRQAEREKQLALQQREAAQEQRRRQMAQRQQQDEQRKAKLETQLAAQERNLAQREQLLARQEQTLQQQMREPEAHIPATEPHVSLASPAPTDLLVQARMLHTEEKLAQARQAHQANQYHLAAKLYQEVLKLSPERQEAIDALALVQSRMGLISSPQGVLETELQARTIRGNAAIAEFQELMSRADSLLGNESFAAARESVQQAKITLDVNQRFLPTTRYRSLRDNAVNLAAKIADAERRIQEDQRRELEIVRKTEAEKRRIEALMAQRQETERLLRRAADLRREQKYNQALELINQALFLDPNNVAAQAMKEMIQDSQLYVDSRDLMQRRNQLIAHQSSENLDASTPYADLMTYPPDWPQLTATRLGGADPNAVESEVNRRVALKLRDSVPVDFDNNKLVNIIEYFRNTTGVNFFVNWAVLESIDMSKDTPVTLQLTNVPVDQALRLVLQQASGSNEQDPVTYSIIEGVVTVSTDRDLAKATDIRPYDIRDLLVQVPNFAEAPEFDLNSALSNTNSGGSSSGGGGGDGGGDSIFGGGEGETEELTREEMIEQVIGLIQNTVGKQADWEAQGGQGSIRELNGNLIVKTTPKNHREIAQLLSQLRETRALQIAVESRFLVVDQNFLDEVGVDLDIDFDVGSSPGKFGPVTLEQDSNTIAKRQTSDLTPDVFDSLTSFDLNVSYLDDISVRLMVKATQASRRSITLTAPRLTLMNGQRAFVVVARQITFISDLEPIPDAAGFDPTLSVTQSGVILDVEGTVSADRRYVTMTVRPSLANLIQPIRTIALSTSFVEGDSSNILANNNVNIEAPEIELTSIKTTVSVPDRGTLLLGGQRIVADTEIEAGVPVLSKIPVLNRLFTNTSTVKDERTLLILIKPTIIIQSEEEELNFPGLLQNPQQYGIGHRL